MSVDDILKRVVVGLIFLSGCGDDPDVDEIVPLRIDAVDVYQFADEPVITVRTFHTHTAVNLRYPWALRREELVLGGLPLTSGPYDPRYTMSKEQLGELCERSDQADAELTTFVEYVNDSTVFKQFEGVSQAKLPCELVAPR